MNTFTFQSAEDFSFALERLEEAAIMGLIT
jgi:hypothetical protein